ncbi:hypothetical protein H0H87_010534 [Tephrocybe sp. NHM501043]|nr:hypothetical protein H0H87_010534 [Tephrocybe sp. NHM501043]
MPKALTTTTYEVAIPRPPNCFILYKLDQVFPEGTAFRDHAQLSGARWRAESKEVKDKYKKLAKREAAEHKKKYPGYKYAPISKAQKEAQKELKAAARCHAKGMKGVPDMHLVDVLDAPPVFSIPYPLAHDPFNVPGTSRASSPGGSMSPHNQADCLVPPMRQSSPVSDASSAAAHVASDMDGVYNYVNKNTSIVVDEGTMANNVTTNQFEPEVSTLLMGLWDVCRVHGESPENFAALLYSQFQTSMASPVDDASAELANNSILVAGRGMSKEPSFSEFIDYSQTAEDSSGGAGVQADLKTIAAHGCYGTSAVTALTSQNTTGVQAVHPTPLEFVEKQIHSILDDIETHAIKTGMLYNGDCVKAVIRSLTAHYSSSSLPPIVCDPVCVSTSGHSLLDPDAIQVLVDEFFPLTTLITPNQAEAELLLSHRGVPCEIKTIQDMVTAAKSLLRFGSHAVLLKGGHVITSMNDVEKLSRQLPGGEFIYSGLLSNNMEILQVDNTRDPKLVADVLCDGDQISVFVRPYIQSTSTHGTGCTLSAAIASHLARGSNLKEAVREAVTYTHLAIQTAEPIGHGHGPLNHFHAAIPRLIPRASLTDPYPFVRLLIEGNVAEWKGYVEHDFVKLLGRGTLPRKAFVHFMIATKTIMNIIAEIETHKSFCASFGVSEKELENTPEAAATTAYGAYLIDIGLQGDSTRLLMALLACLLGYGEVGLWLKKEAALQDTWVIIDGNPYKRWMDDYSGQMYQGAVKLGLALIESRAVEDPPSPARLAEWVQVWERCTKFERGFWDAAMAVA